MISRRGPVGRGARSERGRRLEVFLCATLLFGMAYGVRKLGTGHGIEEVTGSPGSELLGTYGVQSATYRLAAETPGSSSGLDNNNETEAILEEEAHHADAVLFPSFCLTIGALAYITLTRFHVLAHALPYTAVLFSIGAVMGVATTYLSTEDNKLHESLQIWTNIDSEVLLLVFLPGLIYKDAYDMNVHLFRVSIMQTLIFAIPMVLAGTTLTALVGYYMLPFKWSFNLCMTFGSILSATDPVAVAALLNEVGAPPRLKVHINGEALLNDGSAIVFYSIFVLRYLYELGIEGVGEDVGVARGVALFFQKSLGGAACGLFFGLSILFMLKVHNRRFSREESVSEVAAVLGLAYVGYWCSDYVWKTSGVIATLTAGVTVKYLGRAIVNDEKLMNDFWSLLEHILNTVLFTLGGLVWGETLVSGQDALGPKMWGYLVMLYVMLVIIRAVLFFAVYPLTKRIGLSTCWQETVFQIHGGLRGAVGIALALSLDSEVNHLAEGGEVDPLDQNQTRQVFALVGGIAFMTLILNAPTCKPLLHYLKLAESSETRSKIIDSYRVGFRRNAIQDMVKLLAQPRFSYINFAIIESHVPFLKDLATSQLMEAVERHRETTPAAEYKAPNLGRILPYIVNDAVVQDVAEVDTLGHGMHSINQRRRRRKRQSTSTLLFMMKEEPRDVSEFRLLFLSILRSAYGEQIAGGELAERGFLALSLEQSLDLATDHVAKGEPLNDWDYIDLVSPTLSEIGRKWKGTPTLLGCMQRIHLGTQSDWIRAAKRLNIERAMAFMAAHRYAQEYFTKEFGDADSELSEAGKMVISESKAQWLKAESVLKGEDPCDVERIVSHKFCSILLSSSINYIGKLVEQGFLREDEAELWVSEVEHELDNANMCDDSHGVHDHDCEEKPADVETVEKAVEIEDDTIDE